MTRKSEIMFGVASAAASISGPFLGVAGMDHFVNTQKYTDCAVEVDTPTICEEGETTETDARNNGLALMVGGTVLFFTGTVGLILNSDAALERRMKELDDRDPDGITARVQAHEAWQKECEHRTAQRKA